MDALFELHAEVDARVAVIRRDRVDWPCGKGCDHCCRRLAEIPRLTATEWQLLKEGLTGLSAECLGEIQRKVVALAGPSSRPVVCPLLDQETGSCPVYAYRPVACRTYGFYVERGIGLYCCSIEVLAAEGGLEGVIWGNQEAIERRLAALGETRTLVEWFADEGSGGPPFLQLSEQP